MTWHKIRDECVKHQIQLPLRKSRAEAVVAELRVVVEDEAALVRVGHRRHDELRRVDRNLVLGAKIGYNL